MKDLNLIPKSYFIKHKKKRKKIITVTAAAGAAVLIMGTIAAPLTYRYYLEKNRDSIFREVANTSTFVKTVNQLNTVRSAYKTIEDEGNNLVNKGVKTTKIITEIEKNLPEKFFINSITINEVGSGKANISLNCVSATEEDAASFINSIRKQKCFNNIVVPGLKKNALTSKDTGYVSFTMTLTYIN